MKKCFLSILFASLLLVACGDEKSADGDKKETMTASGDDKEQRNKKVIMESMENFIKGDIDATFKDADPSFVDYADGTIPPIHNLDSLKAFVRMLTASIEGYKGQNLTYYTDGNHVIVHGDWGGTFKNDLMGIEATGKPVAFKDVDLFTFNENGKITEHRSVQNIAAILMAASAMK